MHVVSELVGDHPGVIHDPASFRKSMLKFCKRHQREKRALVFAFFIYDFRDAQIIKVFRDKDYWSALDDISGSAITVFACNSPADDDDRALEIRRNLRLFLAGLLGENIRFDSPSILFFQVDNQKVIDSFFAVLHKKNIEESFNEMRDIIEWAVRSVAKVTEENRRNFQDIFYLVEQELSRRQLVMNVKKGVEKAMKASSVIKALSGVYH